MIKVFLVDDHPMVLAGFKEVLEFESNIKIVGKSNTIAGIVELAQPIPVDVLLVDIILPETKLQNALTSFRNAQPNTKIILVSMKPENELAILTKAMCAHGFISKDRAANDLIDAVNCVMQGETYPHNGKVLQPSTTQHTDKEPSFTTYVKELLSKREFEVCVLKFKCYSNREVATILDINEKTVSTYLTRVQEKLGVKSIAELNQLLAKKGFDPDKN